MRVITFSRYFPAYHPRKGEPTFFVEKIWSCLDKQDIKLHKFYNSIEHNNELFEPKFHTIRVGNRWKVGDIFSPRVWSGKPYASKQIEISPDIEIKRTQKIELECDKDYRCLLIDDKVFVEWNKDLHTNTGQLDLLAKNDGLCVTDLIWWFNKPFIGQIICWNENINY